MAISTYAELQTAVSNWLKRSDLTSYLADLITVGETRIFRELRTKDLETAFSTAISSGTIATPTSYLDLKFAYINASPVRRLKRRSAAWIYENYPTRAAEGKPAFIAREGSTFIFGPYPDSNYTVAGVYYKNVGPLSSSAHAAFTNNPDLYLYAALIAAEPFIKNDKRLPLWETQYQNILRLANQQDRSEEYSGSSMEVTPG